MPRVKGQVPRCMLGARGPEQKGRHLSIQVQQFLGPPSSKTRLTSGWVLLRPALEILSGYLKLLQAPPAG